ncbi:unnamed protein product [Trifolium pratense]|uniref:Uncharacterized protein n=1 Tax=Trifolium pratense TaxID=57577 RepID=A0ACB0IUD5_TRIPR|nr:unnamed protein product [Trifolium pratense]
MRSAANGMQNDFTEDELSDQILRQAQNFLPHKYEVVSMVLFQKVRLICYQGMLLCAKFCRKEQSSVRYIPRYTFSWLVKPMWLVIKFLHRAVDLTLVPSVAIGRDLQAARVTAANKIRLWNKGVDFESFHTQYRSHEMKLRPKPLIVHVGWLGVEKSLDFLKGLMDKLPEA